MALHFTPSDAHAGDAAGGKGESPLKNDLAQREFMEPDRGALDSERAKKMIEHAKERRRRLAELPPPIPLDHEDPVRLGVDDSEAQTMNWIGYDEYQEHLAELAEVEQAAFRMRVASGASGTAPTGLPPTEPNLTSAQASETALASTLPGNSAPSTANVEGTTTNESSVTPPVVLAVQPEDAATEEKPTPAAAASAATAPESVEAQAAHEATAATDAASIEEISLIKLLDTPDALPSEGEHTVPLPPLLDPNAHPSPDQPATEEIKPVPPSTDPIAPEVAPAIPETIAAATPAPTPATPPSNNSGTPDPNASPMDSNGGATPAVTPTEETGTQPTPPTPSGKPSEVVSREGALSDRESDPTSVIDVPPNIWRSGRPLAAKGITLKTKRPTFTALNMIDGIGRNPIAELVLGRDGKTLRARLVRSTGNPSADEALINSLYGWSASGKQVERLKPGDTMTIRIRLILLTD
ncbi:MAG: hypothetical protein EXS10_09900 [Phycisphaerales bacterium]|nr:hypothetical protein [Phycisphaerales bacterium]